jgi:anti-anti-sigma factor
MHHHTSTRPGARRWSGTSAWIAVTATAEHTAVAVAGALEMPVTDRLAAQLKEELSHLPRALIVDLTRVGFCSARGLDVLLEVVAAARAAGIPIAVVADGRAVRRPVQLLQLEHVLPLHRTLADAEDRLTIATGRRGSPGSLRNA